MGLQCGEEGGSGVGNRWEWQPGARSYKPGQEYRFCGFYEITRSYKQAGRVVSFTQGNTVVVVWRRNCRTDVRPGHQQGHDCLDLVGQDGGLGNVGSVRNSECDQIQAIF